MTVALSVSGIVSVNVSLSPIAAAVRNFGALLIAGSSNIIDVVQRIRSYATLAAVAADFGTTAPEYLAAVLFFSQSPTPSLLYVGRWASDDTSGLLNGGPVPAAQRLVSYWTPITDGSLRITIDGTVRNLTGLNFSAVTSMTGVASVLNTALSSWGACVWNSVYNRLEITSLSTGAATAAASGSVTLTTNTADLDTLTIAGTAITFIAAGPAVGNQVVIGVSATATTTALLAFLQASVDVNLVKCDYTALSATAITVTAATEGWAGNALTLAKTGTHLTLSGATLAGGDGPSTVSYGTTTGSGTDVSAPACLTSATGAQAPVDGIDAETALAAVTRLAADSNQWYGLQMASDDLIDADVLAVAAFIEAATPSRIHGYTTQDSAALSASSTDDMAAQLDALGYNRTFTQYSSSSAYADSSIFGRAFTVDFAANNTTITLKFKDEPGVAAEHLTETQASVLRDKHCNVFVAYDNATAIIQEGVMCSGVFFDEIHGLDWLQNEAQTEVYNLLYGSTTKIPQTDAGVNQIASAVAAACERGVENGLLAPGVWTGPPLGAIKTGDTLTQGYYVYAPSVASQSDADRLARIAPTLQVAVKLAGAVHFANIVINVNR